MALAGTPAPLGSVTGVIVDADGSPILVDSDNCIVARIRDGVLSVIAGNGVCTSSGDGAPATSAALDRPYSAALDRQGNLIVLGQNRIRSVSANRMVTLASVASMGGVAIDGAGNTYFADSAGHVVRKVAPGGAISTVAGNGTAGASGDGGPATSARLSAPSGVALDKDGNLYIADSAGGSGSSAPSPPISRRTALPSMRPGSSTSAESALSRSCRPTRLSPC